MKYFTIEELCKSDTADELGIKNTPDAVAMPICVSWWRMCSTHYARRGEVPSR